MVPCVVQYLALHRIHRERLTAPKGRLKHRAADLLSAAAHLRGIETMYRFTAIALAACTIAAAPLAAFAGDDFTAKVKTADLNLQTEQGAKTALDRIMREAKRVCTPEVEVGTRIPHADAACINNVSAKMVERLNAPMV